MNNRVMRWEQGKREGIVVAGFGGKGNGRHQLNAPTGICLERLGSEPTRVEAAKVPLSSLRPKKQDDAKSNSAWMVEGPGSGLKQLQMLRANTAPSLAAATPASPGSGCRRKPAGSDVHRIPDAES